jgi:hypothetical protein
MKQYEAGLVKLADDGEALRFFISEAPLDVGLTEGNGVEDLREVYEALLADLIHNDVHIELKEKQSGTTAMYQDVCREWIKVLNQDLATVRQEMIEKGIAQNGEMPSM